LISLFLQVLTIWEGTTNVLSLDVLRAMVKSQGLVLQTLVLDVSRRMNHAAGHPELGEAAEKVRRGAEDVLSFAGKNAAHLELAARDFAYSIARVAMGKALVCVTLYTVSLT
jgi:hypothetical protein